jgi:hypothetical protein
MAIADSPAIARRSGPPAAPVARPPPRPDHAAIGPPERTVASLGDNAPGGAPLGRTAGFAIHQLLAAMPELRGPPPDLRQTLGAYRAHLASRIHYSGPVRPVDLRV